MLANGSSMLKFISNKKYICNIRNIYSTYIWIIKSMNKTIVVAIEYLNVKPSYRHIVVIYYYNLF